MYSFERMLFLVFANKYLYDMTKYLQFAYQSSLGSLPVSNDESFSSLALKFQYVLWQSMNDLVRWLYKFFLGGFYDVMFYDGGWISTKFVLGYFVSWFWPSSNHVHIISPTLKII